MAAPSHFNLLSTLTDVTRDRQRDSEVSPANADSITSQEFSSDLVMILASKKTQLRHENASRRAGDWQPRAPRWPRMLPDQQFSTVDLHLRPRDDIFRSAVMAPVDSDDSTGAVTELDSNALGDVLQYFFNGLARCVCVEESAGEAEGERAAIVPRTRELSRVGGSPACNAREHLTTIVMTAASGFSNRAVHQ